MSHLQWVVLAIGVECLFGCGETSHNGDPSHTGGLAGESSSDAGKGLGGGGGLGGSATAATGGSDDVAAGIGGGIGGLGGGGGQDCTGFAKECCASPTRTPCMGLDENDCGDLSYCKVIRGVSWTFGEPVPRSSTDTVFVGCRSDCSDAVGADAFTCIFRQSAPGKCYFVRTELAVPDGWVGLEECEQRPADACVE
jgi:hypothetical protein